MNRMHWLCLFWCILPGVVFSKDVLNVLKSCKKIVRESKVADLDCRNLDFEKIPTNIFYITNKRIYLSENPYICDCGIVWFIRGLQRKSFSVKIEDVDLMTCGAVIKNMAGRRIRDLKKDDVCSRKVKSCHGLGCSYHALCVQNPSTDSGGQCVCKAGLQGNGTFCEDVDECSKGSHNCDIYQDCRNTFSSFECNCKSGLKINSKGHCDVAEPCEIVHRPCDSSKEVCVNKKRGYECSCKKGYHKHSKTNKCSDVNECPRRNSCSKQALCFNTIGSYHCVCEQGYSGNGKVCEDIDECSTGDHSCPSDRSICVNSVGGYKCHCKPGFRVPKNGTVCVKKEDKNKLKNKIIVISGAGVVVLLILTICCCCWCCKRKSKKSKKGSNTKLIDDTANQDLLNLAMETDPFLLQQQAEQQMYMFNMQQQQQYMPYFGDETVPPVKKVQPNESSMTTWSDDDEYAEYYPGYDDDTYN